MADKPSYNPGSGVADTFDVSGDMPLGTLNIEPPYSEKRHEAESRVHSAIRKMQDSVRIEQEALLYGGRCSPAMNQLQKDTATGSKAVLAAEISESQLGMDWTTNHFFIDVTKHLNVISESSVSQLADLFTEQATKMSAVAQEALQERQRRLAIPGNLWRGFKNTGKWATFNLVWRPIRWTSYDMIWRPIRGTYKVVTAPFKGLWNRKSGIAKGAAIGAAAGSLVPGVGWVAGPIIGGVIGAKQQNTSSIQK
jgi:hypothetical protein